MAEEWDVFLSYSWADRDLVLRVKGALEAGGMRVFLDQGNVKVCDLGVKSVDDVVGTDT